MEYILDGTKIIYERVYNTATGTPALTSETIYSYDSMGTPNGARVYVYNGTTATTYEFFFRTTIQGDVLAIYDGSTNAQVVHFNYDAWGNHTVTNYTSDNIGDINPFRYRGYYFDSETNFYYLNSRYYNPQVKRFLNADIYVSTGQGFVGFNMYAYCNNNPVNMTDQSGNWPQWLTKVIIVVVSGVLGLILTDAVADKALDKAGANDAEKEIAKNDYVAAYQANQSKNIAIEYMNEIYGSENDIDGTQVNAFRHAMWNAVMTDKMGYDKAKMFADAHEAIPNNPKEHMEMDFHNNELGRKIAIEYAGQGYDVFAQKIREAINNGEAKVIKWIPNIN